MDQKNEVHAVSAAAAFLIAALVMLERSSESLGIGIRNVIGKELQRLGPDHKPNPFSREQLRALVAGQYGEEVAADVIDGKGAASAEEVKAKDDVRDLTDAVKALMEENKRLREDARTNSASEAKPVSPVQPTPPPSHSAAPGQSTPPAGATLPGMGQTPPT